MLLVFPLAKPITKKAFPVVTFGLMLLNIFIYLTAQLDDNEHAQNALNYYFTSGIADVELPGYPAYLEQQGADTDVIKNTKAVLEHENPMEIERLGFRISLDKQYHQYLEDGGVQDESSFAWQEWKKKKHQFQDKLSYSNAYNYGLFPSDLNIVNLFTYQFLHGSVDHLLGNMVFLGLIGVSVEITIGGAFFLLFYLLTGVVAGLAHSYFNITEVFPLVGASGSIAGLTGLYTLIFGLQKIKIFYFVFVYFNYAYTRAILLLPFWFCKELYYHFTDQYSNVAYLAHAGGIASGAAIGLIWRLSRKVPITETATKSSAAVTQDEQPTIATEQSILMDAQREITLLNFFKAEQILTTGLETYPSSFALTHQLYNLRKRQPKSEQFTASLKQLLAFSSSSTDIIKKQAHAFQSAVIGLKLKPKMNVETIIRLSSGFIHIKQFELAEKLIQIMVKNKPDHLRTPQLIADIAHAYRSIGHKERFAMWSTLLFDNYPGHDAIARLAPQEG